jgi:CRP-like cAMP-binding protein
MITIMARDFHTYLSSLSGISHRYSQGQLVFERDDPVDSLFVVDSGEVHLLRRQEDGAEFILQRATAGTVLAEASLTTPRYHCAAVAVPTRSKPISTGCGKKLKPIPRMLPSW